MFVSTEDIEKSLAASGIKDDDAARLTALARPLVWLRTRQSGADADIKSGTTKIGGDPDLPAGMDWPMRPAFTDAEKRTENYAKDASRADSYLWATRAQREEMREDAKQMGGIVKRPFPLAFVAQLNLADIWSAGPVDPDLPRQGMLSIFYDTLEQPWGFQVSDHAGARIVFNDTTTPESLDRKPPPVELTTVQRYPQIKPLACDRRAALAPVPWELAAFERLGLGDDVNDGYRDWIQKHAPATSDGEDWGCHRVSGWPTPVQGDMQTQAALISRGHYLGNSEGYLAGKAKGDDRDATDWVLIAQIGSDGKADIMWGDVGQLYVWIRRDSLKARRFENALIFQQSY